MEQQTQSNSLISLEANITATLMALGAAEQSQKDISEQQISQLYGVFAGVATSYLQAVQDPELYQIASRQFDERLEATGTNLESIISESMESPDKARFVNEMIEKSIQGAYVHLEKPAEAYLNLPKRQEIDAAIERGLNDPQMSEQDKLVLNMYKAVADISMQNSLDICQKAFGYIPHEAKAYLPSPPNSASDSTNYRDAA